MQVIVKSYTEVLPSEGYESLIAELSYIIARLHRDMYMQSQSPIPLVHEVIILSPNKSGEKTVCQTKMKKCELT